MTRIPPDIWPRATRPAISAAVSIALSLLLAPPLAAHLMEHQHGSLNMVEQRGYLVLSVPVSALSGVDDNRDRRVDDRELQRHTTAIERQLRAGVRIIEGGKPVRLDGLLVNLSPDEQHREGPATHLVMLAVAMFDSAPRNPVIDVRLFGRLPAERRYRFTATRRQADGANPNAITEQSKLTLTPTNPRQILFAGT
ncbi:MAG: hypothetical protein FGM43_02530 [Sinobacteraceae bacterium]|nr:hypothetical protein [Nevskiaceae bacterium]